MKKLLLVSTAVAGIMAGCSAYAADLPLKAPIPMVAAPAAYNWSGCYIGVNGGAGILFDSVTGQHGDGGLAGGQIGCNYQTGMLVLGIEGEGFWSGMKSTYNEINSNPETFTLNARNTADFDIAGRFGLAFDRALVYGKAGVVWGRFGFNGIDSVPGHVPTPATFNYQFNSTTFDGLLIGLGLEYGITTNWTAKFEYDYLGFVSRSVGETVTCSTLCGGYPFYEHQSQSADKQIVKVGLNYRFSFLGPGLDWGTSETAKR
jgi:outer membrane immunogenic protein